MCTDGGRVSQAEGRASAKALRKERNCHIQGRARRAVWLKRGERGERMGAKGEGRGKQLLQVFVAGWGPQEADSEMEVGVQKVY